MGVLDHHYKLFFVPPANPIILEVTKGTTKIDDPSIRPEGGIPINSNHPSGMPLPSLRDASLIPHQRDASLHPFGMPLSRPRT